MEAAAGLQEAGRTSARFTEFLEGDAAEKEEAGELEGPDHRPEVLQADHKKASKPRTAHAAPPGGPKPLHQP